MPQQQQQQHKKGGALALRRKWLAFRALEGKLSLAESSENEHQRHGIHLALGITIVGTVFLCSLNDDPFRTSGPMCGIVQAAFCIIAAMLYGSYMVMSILFFAVHTCTERSHDLYQDRYRHTLYRSVDGEEDDDFLIGKRDRNDDDFEIVLNDEMRPATAATTTATTGAAAAAGQCYDKHPHYRPNNNNNNNHDESRCCEEGAMMVAMSQNLLPPNHNDDDDNDDDDDINNNNRNSKNQRNTSKAPPDFGTAAGATASTTTTTTTTVVLPREVVISSMYLGGTGAFLAVAPLCMWDGAVTLAFMISLFLVSVMDVRGSVIKKSPRLFWTLVGAVVLTLSLAIAIEVSSRLPQMSAPNKLLSSYARLHPLFSSSMIAGLLDPTQQQQPAREGNSSSSSSSSNNNNINNNRLVVAVPDSETRAAIMLSQSVDPPLWPFLIFSAISPILLRAGGGGVYLGGLFHCMSPTQTLETGLPVTVLLAGLVLAWFGPLETALMQTRALFHGSTLWPMLVLAPAFLAASLAFLLYSLRRRSSIISVAVLLLIFTFRQQGMHRTVGEHSLLDISTICSAITGVCIAIWIGAGFMDTTAAASSRNNSSGSSRRSMI